jgi:hypothetical protein
VRSKVEPINWLRRGAKTRSLPASEAHLCCRRLSHLITALLMLARAVPATGRSACRISWNICRDNATRAIWNMTYRPRLTTFWPILISFSRRLVSDYYF